MANGDPFREPRQGAMTLRREYTDCSSLNMHTVPIAPRTCEHALRVAYTLSTSEVFPHPEFKPYHDPAGLASKMGVLTFYTPKTQAFLNRMQGWALADVEYGGQPFVQYTKPGTSNRAGEIVNGVERFLDETEALVKEPTFVAAIVAHKR